MVSPTHAKRWPGFVARWVVALVGLAVIPSPRALDPSRPLNHFVIDQWTTDHGLPQKAVTAIAQTRDGYLWVGTFDGIARFDGVTFTVMDKWNLPALGGNNIFAAHEDRAGNFWIATSDGLACRRDGRWIHYDSTHGLASNFILTIHEDLTGRLWFGTTHGLCWFADGVFVAETLPGMNDRRYVSAMTRDRDGRLWVGTDGDGLFVQHNGRTTRIDEGSGLPGNQVRALCLDPSGQVWAATNRGLARFANGEPAATPLPPELAAGDVRALQVDHQGSVWIGSGDGMLYRYREGELDRVAIHGGIPNNSIYAIREDQEGSLWLGTYRSGLMRLKDNNYLIFNSRNGLPVDSVRALFEDRAGRIWVGTVGGGMARYSGGRFQVYDRADGLPDDRIWSFAEAGDGSLWVGTYGGGLFQFRDGVRRGWSTRNGLSNNIVRAICVDRNGDVWVGTNGGGVDIIRDGRVIRNHSTRNGLTDNFIYMLHQDRQGRMWVGTYNGGLLCFDDGRWTAFGTADGFTDAAVWCMHEDRHGDAPGTLWIGTNGSGIYRYRDGRFTRLTAANGLLSDLAFQIVEDEQGDLWVLSNRGIFKGAKQAFNQLADGETTRIAVTSFEGVEGVSRLECDGPAQPAGICTRDGKLWFATTRGAIMIDPAYNRVNTVVPNVVIERVVVDGRYLKAAPVIQMAPGTERIAIGYTALSLLAPQKVRFRYQLEGFERDWSPLTRQRTVSYTNLSPGDYTFRVTACNNDGIWNRTGARIVLTLHPYFYQTAWFRILVALAIIGAALGAHVYRLRRLRARQQELERLVGERVRDLRLVNNQLIRANELKSELLSIAAHDLKNPLQAVLGYAEMILQQHPQREELERRVNKIFQASQEMLSMINELLQSSQIESGEMELDRKPVNLSLLAHLVVDGYRDWARKKGQSFTEAIEADCFVLGDTLRLKEILDNLVSNAVKFSPRDGVIDVRVASAENRARFEIRDNGSGLTPDDLFRIFGRFQRLSTQPTGGESSTGLGLYITKRLVEMHHGTIRVESSPGAGSVFIVDFPATDETSEA